MEAARLKLLVEESGNVPFEEWYRSIKDQKTRQIIQAKLTALCAGKRGNCKKLDEGITELKIYYGSGYRVYFASIEKTIIVLIDGGDKSSQVRDIEKVKKLWNRYKHEIKRFQRDF